MAKKKVHPINPASLSTSAEIQKAYQLGQITIQQAQTRLSQLGISATGKQKTPLGVPKGFTRTVAVPDTSGPTMEGLALGVPSDVASSKYKTIGPQYYQGDEWGGGLKNFPTNPDDVGRLQGMLEKIGYLKPGTYIPTVWNAVSAQAFANILKEANAAGKDWVDQTTADLTAVDKSGALDAAQRHRNPLTIKLSDPATIAETVNGVAKDLHGTYMSPDEIARFTTQYQQSESAYQSQVYNASGFNPVTGQQDTSGLDSVDPGQAGVDVVTKAPDMQALASQTIRNAHPEQFQANTFTDRLNEILAGLRGAPTTTQVGPR